MIFSYPYKIAQICFLVVQNEMKKKLKNTDQAYLVCHHVIPKSQI